ncbi:retinoid-inducible serine carboxypeptidase [Talpa occidentalis]|uniref:retinoid-inducible serine carboxypeptidase n=1 Tax=Talpa occidentalis TaxID=50954 RepID=UPI00188FEE3A|nr:retinoid-inducible serine carboxypeptidase [Talpa occidentalis]XP_054544552.1 retinoid-inducible serine carboxypeptidase [Talpa occidentalis]XP_054544553.1 retinoid-inducible serine carboxypeptidase [Talpa occidentalis]
MEPAPRSPLVPPPLLLLQLLLLLGLSSGAVINQPTVEGKEVWDYVTVRKDAHMFWWLYYATNSCKNFSELPLVMWLQGGPGGSSTGFGNFEEIGPLDSDLKPRKTTWLQSASLLFVDNPVGAGYSYVNKSDAYAKDLATVASDMMVLLKTFFDCHKEFQKIPFYIFSESYGGKMAAGIGLELHKAIQQGTIQCNFAGVALGDSWISPVDSVLSWGPYLYSMSLLDDQGLAEVSQAAEQVLDAINKGRYKEATELWGEAENVIEQNTDGVNFYNILTKDTPMSAMKSSLEFTQSHLVHLCQRYVRRLHQDALSQLMNGPIRKKLKIIPEDCSWGAQAPNVFINMQGDFMKAVISIVDELLEAGVNVTVYNGQLDLIVDTMGQEAWVRKLKWAELSKFNQLKWKALYSDPESSETSAFVKSHKNLAFYWILRAGHMVPSDQGEMALKMMRLVTHQE